jgi:hypothetical protein
MSFASLSTHIAVLATVLCTSFVHASSRKTPWLYSPNIMNVGEVEYEQYTTWKTNKQSDSEYSEVRFRHSIEWGAAENLQTGVTKKLLKEVIHTSMMLQLKRFGSYKLRLLMTLELVFTAKSNTAMTSLNLKVNSCSKWNSIK